MIKTLLIKNLPFWVNFTLLFEFCVEGKPREFGSHPRFSFASLLTSRNCRLCHSPRRILYPLFIGKPQSIRLLKHISQRCDRSKSGNECKASLREGNTKSGAPLIIKFFPILIFEFAGFFLNREHWMLRSLSLSLLPMGESAFDDA